MTPNEALAILEKSSADFRGTKADHIKIQEAVNMLQRAIEPKVETPVVEEIKE